MGRDARGSLALPVRAALAGRWARHGRGNLGARKGVAAREKQRSVCRALAHLGREVAQPRTVELVEALLALELWDGEVGQLAPVFEIGVCVEVLGEEEEVARLERAVDEARVVDLFEAVADLREEVPYEGVGQAVLPLLHRENQVMQRAALGKLRHVAQPPFVEKGAVVLHDIRVLQVEQNLHLLHGALLALGRHAFLQVDALECKARLQLIHVRRHVAVRLLANLACPNSAGVAEF